MKLKNRILFLLSLAAMLSGCATAELPVASQSYNPSDSARIRLFGQNQKPSTMVVQVGQGADTKSIEVNVGGTVGDAFGSMLHMAENKSIGMPETENTRNITSRNGILSKAFYREFVIPADKPVKVSNAFIGLSSATPMPSAGVTVIHQQGSCTGNAIVFTPQAGKDYEVVSAPGYSCSAKVFNIQKIDGKISLVPLQID
jgi:hypothetical protein